MFHSFPDTVLCDSSIDVLKVRALFSSPIRFANSAFLRREIADRMHERLSMVKIEPHFVLDAGSGEGVDLPILQNRFPQATIVALDASHNMLLSTRSAVDARQKKIAQTVCANFAELPFASDALDVLWSNLSLHWHPDPLQVFTEWKRVLGKEGLLMFSCFGPDTLSLLRQAFCEADNYAHVLPFMEMHDLGDRLVQAGFLSPVLDRETITVTYQTAENLLSDVRAFGGNPLHGRRRNLMGKTRYRRLIDFIESLKDQDGKISLPFEIIYGHAFCSSPEMEKPVEAPVHFFPR